MKVLVVYYSLTGNVKLIAENIAAATDADLLRLETKKREDKKSFMRHLWLGWQILRKNKPELLAFNPPVDNYDLIFLGTPVWAFTYVPAFRTLFSQIKLSDKKIALFCCHGGGPGKVFQRMREKLHGNTIVGELKLREPLKNDTEEKCEQAKAWATEILQGQS